MMTVTIKADSTLLILLDSHNLTTSMILITRGWMLSDSTEVEFSLNYLALEKKCTKCIRLAFSITSIREWGTFSQPLGWQVWEGQEETGKIILRTHRALQLTVTLTTRWCWLTLPRLCSLLNLPLCPLLQWWSAESTQPSELHIWSTNGTH